MNRARLEEEYDTAWEEYQHARLLMDLPPVKTCRTEYSLAPLGCLFGIALTLAGLWVLILWPIIEFLRR